MANIVVLALSPVVWVGRDGLQGVCPPINTSIIYRTRLKY
jgi:hypothetical protein